MSAPADSRQGSEGAQAAQALRIGLLVAREGPYFRLQGTSGEQFRAMVRGRAYSRRGPFFVGDRVRFRVVSAEEAVVEDRLDRSSFLPQPPVANVDQLLVVITLARPPLDEGLLTRLLVAAEAFQIPPRILLNKRDLISSEDADAFCRRYRKIGYEVLEASAKTGEGLDAVREILRGKVTALAGPSGAGKSTLLNRLIPGASLKTQDVAAKTGRGRQTTSTVLLLPLEGGGLVADTPGFSQLDLSRWLEPEDLQALCPDIREHARCRFTDCTHRDEPGCRVREALDAGALDPVRYRWFQTLRDELEEARRRRHRRR